VQPAVACDDPAPEGTEALRGATGEFQGPNTRQTDAGRAKAKAHHATYIQALPTALSNGQNLLGMSNTGAMKQLRGPKHENSGPACGTRALPPRLGDMALEVAKTGT
jgi:hypothetical protein